MADSNRNRHGMKENDRENRTGAPEPQNHKLPDDPGNDLTDSVSTAGDTSNGKYSKTGKRDDEVDNDDTRGGR